MFATYRKRVLEAREGKYTFIWAKNKVTKSTNFVGLQMAQMGLGFLMFSLVWTPAIFAVQYAGSVTLTVHATSRSGRLTSVSSWCMLGVQTGNLGLHVDQAPVTGWGEPSPHDLANGPPSICGVRHRVVHVLTCSCRCATACDEPYTGEEERRPASPSVHARRLSVHAAEPVQRSCGRCCAAAVVSSVLW